MPQLRASCRIQIRLERLLQTADEEASRDEQHARQRDLRDDQRVARAHDPPGASDTPPASPRSAITAGHRRVCHAGTRPNNTPAATDTTIEKTNTD